MTYSCYEASYLHSLFQVDSSEKLSVVVIQNPMLAHLGHYVCRANNSLGNDFKTVHLKGERKYKGDYFPFYGDGNPCNGLIRICQILQQRI